jgi:hypothetical protein
VPRSKSATGPRLTIVAVLLLSAAAGSAAAAPAAELRWRCTNMASGASWTIVVDPAGRRVDRFPATIGERWISWRDPERGFFDLDRVTGALRLRNASSTGGYFLYYRCRQE